MSQLNDPVGRVTLDHLSDLKARGERWAMLTAYDFSIARVFDDVGIPVLLVGDSAAGVMYGYESTLPITLDEMLPMVRGVVRAARRALVVADLPFGTYQSSAAQALNSATRLMKEGGAHAVKLEGGERILDQVALLVQSGVPVMGHLGLTPQSVHQLGGYRVQGRGEAGAQLLRDARALTEAGAFSVVLEVVPASLARQVTEAIPIPTIGIGAGNATDAQVLVWQDLLGLGEGPHAKFVQTYADLKEVVGTAVTRWRSDVQSGAYPDEAHSYE
jgi:3-methyl-2-oxobutanoate hydroxymethyltransferase